MVCHNTSCRITSTLAWTWTSFDAFRLAMGMFYFKSKDEDNREQAILPNFSAGMKKKLK
jgi:hypothetical protein